MRKPVVMVSASANRVLGEYDHSFSIGSNDEFVIIYGPNGVGKTRFLEIIDAITRLSGFSLALLPFESAKLRYSDGSTLSVLKTLDSNSPDESAILTSSIDFKLDRPGETLVEWTYKDDGFEEWARQHLPYEQISDSTWQDPSDGEIISTDDLRRRFAGAAKQRKHEPIRRSKELDNFVKLVPSFLIETQRLRIEQAISPFGSTPFHSGRGSGRSRSRITEQAETIRSLVNGAQTEHSRITQQLDRTFPNRVLSDTSVHLDSDSIRKRYDQQNDFRSRLGRVASVALDDELSLPEGKLEDWALKLLNLYLEDADQKLAPFENLLKKIELLEQIINARLLNKHLQVTDGEGLSVRHSVDERPISLDSLSSGEQHVIILMIDLLFNVPSGAVVLIDEPEISLHVVWQLTFIPDVQRIAKLAGFRFVVATHSPQIINDQWGRAIRLGPPEVAFQ